MGKLKLKKVDIGYSVLFPVLTTDQIRLNPRDRLDLYSDGITETFSPSDEIYGEDRLKQFLLDNRHLPSDFLLTNLENVLQDFRKGGDLTDDISLIYLKR